jgi:S-adenosyl-L-methionine hydrolase (adenosine-forming)
MPPLITFLTDFGLADDFVGTCKGVIATIAPEARVIDITHGIGPGRVLQGALVLANTLPYMPAGIHLAVVDPGVGSGRRALAIRDAAGRLYVGPDNGLLVPAADGFGGVVAAHELANPDYSLQPVSRTFHGRDLFAPAAAHLANAVELTALGPAVEPDSLVRLEIPKAEIGQSRIRATALGVDRFGNIALNVRRDELAATDLGPGRRIELTCRGEHFYAVAARTFADAPRGQLIVYDDSYSNLSLAVSNGSAAQLLRAGEGTEILLELDAP